MAESTALDLLKSLATDRGFRSQLQALDAKGKRALLQRCGFGTLTAPDVRMAAASVFGAQIEAAQSVASTASMSPMPVAASASLIETVDGRALTPMPVAAGASAIETVDGRALTPMPVAASASLIETVDGRVMASLAVNSGSAYTSVYQQAA